MVLIEDYITLWQMLLLLPLLYAACGLSRSFSPR